MEKEAEAVVVELKPETTPETQTDSNVSDEVDKSPAAAPPTTEPAAVPAEPTPAAPEENRVRLNVIPIIILTQINRLKWGTSVLLEYFSDGMNTIFCCP